MLTKLLLDIDTNASQLLLQWQLKCFRRIIKVNKYIVQLKEVRISQLFLFKIFKIINKVFEDLRA
ncbi:hypothetical protein CU305_07820 [Prochlorococcus marinus str. MU1416]|nr:hypothetical protein [Prochlorococcus marinus str. MU1416]